MPNPENYDPNSYQAVLARIDSSLKSLKEGHDETKIVIRDMDTKLGLRLTSIEEDIEILKQFRTKVRTYIAVVAAISMTIVEAFKAYIGSFHK